MHRLVATLAALIVLLSPAAALADGPIYISQGGLGVLARDGKTRYVAVVGRNGTSIERIRVGDGAVLTWTSLAGYWGLPAPANPASAEGITRDGKKLIVETVGSRTTGFAVLGARYLRVVDRFTLEGDFSYDALSPDGRRLYLVQHTDLSNINRYVVRAYDLRSHTLLPGRIADRTQRGWVMEGSAVTRTTSPDGRWVYTLYQRADGYPFIHALDTVNGVAHCIGLPFTGDQMAMWNVRLALVDGGRTLAAHWKSGRPWLAIDTSSWQIGHPHPSAAFPWRWALLGAALLLALAVALAAVTPRLRGPVPARAV